MKHTNPISQAEWDRERKNALAARVATLEAENIVLRDLLTRIHKTYENMTTNAFSTGADRDIRAETAKVLGLEQE